MSTFDDIIKDGKKYYPFARKKAQEQPMSPPPHPQGDDNRGFTQQMTEEQQKEAAELTPEQIAQRSGAETNAPVQPQSGAVSVVSNGAPTTTRIVPEATPQVSPTPSATPTATTPTATTTVAPTPIEQTQGEQIANYVEGKGGMPQDTNSRPSVLGVNKNDEDILREQAGVPKETPETKAEVEDKADAEEEQERKTYEQMLKEMMARRRPRTPEEEEAIRKREKRERLFASIADGLSAMHEAYSYGRGIKPMDIDKVSPKVLARQDRLRLLRNQEDRAWLQNYINVMKAENQRRRTDLLAKKDAEKAKTQQLITDSKVKANEARQRKDEATAAYWETKAELLREGFPLQQAEVQAQIKEREARANKQMQQRTSSRSSRASNPKSNKGGDQGGGSEQVVENTNNLGQTTKKVTTTDANGNKTVKTYDHRGRLVNTQVTHPKRKAQSQPQPKQPQQNSSMSKFKRRN
jgi:hypothetical protein